MPRILISECKQEISSFNPVIAHYGDFLTNRGAEMLEYHRAIRTEVGGHSASSTRGRMSF